MGWQNLAIDAREAADRIGHEACPRSYCNRLYFSVYAMVTGRLASQGVSGFGRRNNPAHEHIPDYVRGTLAGLSADERKTLSTAVRRLWHYRVCSDYLPSVAVDGLVASEAMRAFYSANRVLEGINE